MQDEVFQREVYCFSATHIPPLLLPPFSTYFSPAYMNKFPSSFPPLQFYDMDKRNHSIAETHVCRKPTWILLLINDFLPSVQIHLANRGNNCMLHHHYCPPYPVLSTYSTPNKIRRISLLLQLCTIFGILLINISFLSLLKQ